MRYFFSIVLMICLFSTPAFSEIKSKKKGETHKIAKRSKNFAGFEDGQQAISFFAGQPTFLRYDYWLHWKGALFFDAGYHWDRYFYGAINYAFYFYNTRDFLRKREKNFWNSLLFYGGPGFFAGFSSGSSTTLDNSFKLGVRAFGGVEYLFDGQKLSLRTEVGPAFFIQGQSAISLQAMIGIAYYFGDPTRVDTFRVDDASKDDPSEDLEYEL